MQLLTVDPLDTVTVVDRPKMASQKYSNDVKRVANWANVGAININESAPINPPVALQQAQRDNAFTAIPLLHS
jgi:hypothetical protein